MNRKGKGGKGVRKTIHFESDTKEIIEEYRRERKDIPSFTKAVNEIIRGRERAE